MVIICASYTVCYNFQRLAKGIALHQLTIERSATKENLKNVGRVYFKGKNSNRPSRTGFDHRRGPFSKNGLLGSPKIRLA